MENPRQRVSTEISVTRRDIFTNKHLSGARGQRILFFFWLCWVFVAVHGLSLVAVSGGYSSLRFAGFALQWLLLLRSTGSRHASFSSCGSRA